MTYQDDSSSRPGLTATRRGVLLGSVGAVALSHMSRMSLAQESGASAVLTALDMEREAVAAKLGSLTRKHTVGPYEVSEHEHNGRKFFLATGGIGKVNTAALGATLAENFNPDSFFMVGVCGALDMSLKLHSTVISSELYQVDYGRRENGELIRFRAGALPFGDENLEGWTIPKPWHAAAATLVNETDMRSVHLAPVCSGDHFVADHAYGDLLNRRYGVYTVDMESAALAQVAATRGLPMLTVRTATDNARGNAAVSDFEENLLMASARAAEIFADLAAILPFGA